MKVVKFGGSSLADGDQCQKVVDIIRHDPRIQLVVVSAPGKRWTEDHKITDMLVLTQQLASIGMGGTEVFQAIEDRFYAIGQSIAPDLDLAPLFQEIQAALFFRPSPSSRPEEAGEEGLRGGKGSPAAYAASRGEYLMARLLAQALDFDFVDAADLVRFTKEGRLDEKTSSQLIRQRLTGRKAVVPGFYGAGPDGRVVTFSRGGSDISGALLAAALEAEVYENWTDVSGFLAADPKIVENPQPIRQLTYQELHELAYMGAGVLHEEAIRPARQAGIPIRIKNTNAPEDEGTLILPSLNQPSRVVTGIAGRKGFSSVNVRRAYDEPSSGFFRRLISVFEANHCPIEHMPTSIDTISVIVPDEVFLPKRDEILEEIAIFADPVHIDLSSDLAILAIVGQGMSNRIGVSERSFRALTRARINVEMISQGASEMNIIVGVRTADFEAAVQALYQEFFKEEKDEEI